MAVSSSLAARWSSCPTVPFPCRSRSMKSTAAPARWSRPGRSPSNGAFLPVLPPVLLLQLLINGLQLGAIYALTAVGFSLIFGATKIFHVAHGAAFTIAAYLFWWTTTARGLPWPLGAGLAVLAAVAFGLA